LEFDIEASICSPENYFMGTVSTPSRQCIRALESEATPVISLEVLMVYFAMVYNTANRFISHQGYSVYTSTTAE